MLSFDVEDTIAAIASPQGTGLRGIIRISGQDCLSCLEQVFRVADTSDTAPVLSERFTDFHRRSQHLPVTVELSRDPERSLKLPGQLLVWPSTRSYTRQPSAEFHTFGSSPLLARVLRRLCEAGARPAQPGEFTLRAFLSGRLDLPQAEAVLSVIDARAESQLSHALQQLAGGLSGPLMDIREQLTWIVAEIEAGLDFVEEDIEFLSRDELVRRLSEIASRMFKVAGQVQSRDISAQFLRVALTGLPNAGKSSIFNELLGQQRAIVSSIAGTTTDFLVGQLDLKGLIVELTDTAGIELQTGGEPVESPASQAQQQRAAVDQQAQIKLLCIDSSKPLEPYTLAQLAEMEFNPEPRAVTIVVLTKTDLRAREALEFGIAPQRHQQWKNERRLVETRLPSSENLAELRSAIRYHALELMETQSEMVASTRVRAADALRAAAEGVQRALEGARADVGDEWIAAEIRIALDEIGRVVGTVYTDDILDVVFSRFCIGK